MEENDKRVIFETNGKTYLELYWELIDYRKRNPIPNGVQFEVHHIRPKSIFPELANDPSNLMRLTPKEHVRAHFLLWQHYKLETDDKDGDRKMRFAFWKMVNGVEWEGDAELGWIGERFEELRADFVESISGDSNPMKRPEVREKLMGENNPSKRPEVREKLRGENHHMYGKHLTESARKKISEANKGRLMGENNPSKRPEVREKLRGENNHNFGKNLSEETRAKISEALRGEKNPNFGKRFSEEHRRRMSEARRGHEVSEATRKKLSEEMMGKFDGEKNPFFGKRHSEETRAKISEARTGKLMGDKNPNAKKVFQYAKDGTFLAEFSTVREAERVTGINSSCISMCCHGRHKTAGGFIWKYAESK